MKSILVTGGAGFIGSHLCERLLKDKGVSKVVCVDNLDPSYPVSYRKDNLAILSSNKKFKFFKTDIRNYNALKKIFKKEKFDAVIHLAAKTDTRTSVLEPTEYFSVNVLGTLNLLELSKDFGIKKFIFISSSSIYGNSKAKPPFKESEVTDFPLAPYGATKKSGEVLSYTYFNNYALPVVCIRLFNVYGERMRPGPVLYRWVETIFADKPIEISGKGQRKRDFTYVSDVVDALVKSLKKGSGYEILNIASSKPATLIELLATVEKATGRKVEVRERDSSKASIEVSHADITKAKKVLGWSPRVSLDQGVLNFVRWFKENRIKQNRKKR